MTVGYFYHELHCWFGCFLPISVCPEEFKYYAIRWKRFKHGLLWTSNTIIKPVFVMETWWQSYAIVRIDRVFSVQIVVYFSTEILSLFFHDFNAICHGQIALKPWKEIDTDNTMTHSIDNFNRFTYKYYRTRHVIMIWRRKRVIGHQKQVFGMADSFFATYCTIDMLFMVEFFISHIYIYMCVCVCVCVCL